jgi:small-conductance mechanosensitive channel
MERDSEIVSYETLDDDSDSHRRNICCARRFDSIFECFRAFQEYFPSAGSMVVIKMEAPIERSVRWASITILSMIGLLTIIAIVSGGLTGLGGVPMSIAYCLAIAAPLLVVIGLAWKAVSRVQK